MATFGYGRVSTVDQEPENQQQEIERAGYDIDDETWFADIVSGKVPSMHRPEFASMLERMRRGKRLVVTKLDRLGRDAIDVQATVQMLVARRIEVIVVQLGKVDLTSPAGKLMDDFMLGQRVYWAFSANSRQHAVLVAVIVFKASPGRITVEYASMCGVERSTRLLL